MANQHWLDREDQETASAATWLQERGLAGPAFLFLQTLRPLSFILGQGLTFLHPMLPLKRWQQQTGRAAAIFCDRSRLEGLLAALETHLLNHLPAQDKENTP
ncbi:MAG: hypothetical protein JXA37_07015 [Chloroflexia bacterium]|nr:hypothetical protein [Chloroflexia bacterium]